MTRFPPPVSALRDQEALYDLAVAEHGAAVDRLARSYEADSDKREDLVQEIHLALWRSLASFDERCSLRTWVYRVAHNVAASHVIRQRRMSARLVGLDALALSASTSDTEGATDRQLKIERLHALLRQLRPLDRQIMMLYLEECDAESIGEITGLSAGNIATKIGRIKNILKRSSQRGVTNDR
jgi:RNA polymerase sigma-70 factor (ECF subfamily)